jgi:hypothetical protein
MNVRRRKGGLWKASEYFRGIGTLSHAVTGRTYRVGADNSHNDNLALSPIHASKRRRAINTAALFAVIDAGAEDVFEKVMVVKAPAAIGRIWTPLGGGGACEWADIFGPTAESLQNQWPFVCSLCVVITRSELLQILWKKRICACYSSSSLVPPAPTTDDSIAKARAGKLQLVDTSDLASLE